MKSFVRPSFWRAYERLDDKTREAARKAYRLFQQDPNHPSLQFKKLGRYEHIWSVRISAQYRAVGERRGDTISWAWIGTHNEWSQRELCDIDGQPERASTRERRVNSINFSAKSRSTLLLQDESVRLADLRHQTSGSPAG